MLALFKALSAGAFALVLLVAGTAARGQDVGEFAIGASDAPVTVIEYFSLTCPHCAAFHRDILPKVIEDYIDTGKVRMVFRDFPLDNLAFAAAVIARCMEDNRYLGFVNMLYEQQDSWRSGADPLGTIALLARLGGMSQVRFDTCLNDDQVTGQIVLSEQMGRATFGVRSTPTFIINDRPVEGAITFEEWQSYVDPLVN